MEQDLKEVLTLFEQLRYRHDIWSVFRDAIELFALSISNTVDLSKYEEREQRYLDIIKKYDRSEIELFPQILAKIVLLMSDHGYNDYMGRIFHGLEINSADMGQFFTPYHISQLMAQINFDKQEVEQRIQENGHIILGEPTCGSGGMVIAFAEAMKLAGYNPQQQLLVIASDIDLKCVHMAYIQLSLFGIPAVINHADTLTKEAWGQWKTPAYVLDGWRFRKNRAVETNEAVPTIQKETLLQPEIEQLTLF